MPLIDWMMSIYPTKLLEYYFVHQFKSTLVIRILKWGGVHVTTDYFFCCYFCF